MRELSERERSSLIGDVYRAIASVAGKFVLDDDIRKQKINAIFTTINQRLGKPHDHLTSSQAKKELDAVIAAIQALIFSGGGISADASLSAEQVDQLKEAILAAGKKPSPPQSREFLLNLIAWSMHRLETGKDGTQGESSSAIPSLEEIVKIGNQLVSALSNRGSFSRPSQLYTKQMVYDDLDQFNESTMYKDGDIPYTDCCKQQNSPLLETLKICVKRDTEEKKDSKQADSYARKYIAKIFSFGPQSKSNFLKKILGDRDIQDKSDEDLQLMCIAEAQKIPSTIIFAPQIQSAPNPFQPNPSSSSSSSSSLSSSLPPSSSLPSVEELKRTPTTALINSISTSNRPDLYSTVSAAKVTKQSILIALKQIAAESVGGNGKEEASFFSTHGGNSANRTVEYFEFAESSSAAGRSNSPFATLKSTARFGNGRQQSYEAHFFEAGQGIKAEIVPASAASVPTRPDPVDLALSDCLQNVVRAFNNAHAPVVSLSGALVDAGCARNAAQGQKNQTYAILKRAIQAGGSIPVLGGMDILVSLWFCAEQEFKMSSSTDRPVTKEYLDRIIENDSLREELRGRLVPENPQLGQIDQSLLRNINEQLARFDWEVSTSSRAASFPSSLTPLSSPTSTYSPISTPFVAPTRSPTSVPSLTSTPSSAPALSPTSTPSSTPAPRLTPMPSSAPMPSPTPTPSPTLAPRSASTPTTTPKPSLISMFDPTALRPSLSSGSSSSSLTSLSMFPPPRSAQGEVDASDKENDSGKRISFNSSVIME